MAQGRREGPVEALEALRASVDAGDLKLAYLIHGDADFLKTEAEQAVEKAALASGPVSFNHDRFDGADLDMGRVLSAAMTLPVMAPHRLIHIKAAHKLDEAARVALADYLKAPSDTTILLLSAASIAGRPGWVREVAKVGQVVSLRGLYESEMPAFIQAEARRLGKRMSQDAVRFVKEMVGTNLAEVRTQLQKAALYVGDEPRLEVGDLESVISDISLDTVFAFNDSVGRGDAGEALLQLDRLMTAEPYPARLLAMLHRHFRQLASAFDLIEVRGHSPDDAAGALGVTGGRLYMWKRNLLPQLRGWTPATLGRALSALQHAHRALRSPVPPGLMMERTVLHLCELRRPANQGPLRR